MITSQEEARKYLESVKLHICIPCYGNVLAYATAQGLLRLQMIAQELQLQVFIHFMGNESLVTRARNRLTHRFLMDEKGTHLMFIDADIEFEASDIIRMLLCDVDIVGGAYSVKGINWENVKRAIELNPEIKPEELELAAGRFVLDVMEPNFSVNKPVEVRELGTGFMMIKRDVFQQMAEEGIAVGSKCQYEKDFVCKFWTTGPDENDRELSEDFMFSHMARKLGIKTHLLPDVVLTHIGSYYFKGSIEYMARLTEAHARKQGSA